MKTKYQDTPRDWLNFITGMAVMFCLFSAFTAPRANAQQIGKVETSGLMFKDSIEIHSFNDPDYKAITCYFTLPKRSMSWEDQTNTSISCRLVGTAPTSNLKSKPGLASAAKGIWAKKMQIDRFYDKKRNVMVYISYTKKLSGDNASHSLSVVPLR